MNPVRFLRNQAGITQQELAARARTSQPTIASYETGTKSPTLSTLWKLAASLGLEPVVSFSPRMTREDLRSLAYHRAVATRLRGNPAVIIKRAKRTLKKMRERHPGAKALLDRWNVLLDLPVEELISKMLDHGMPARDMRQVSPFAGVLSPGERYTILAEFRRDRHHDSKPV